jgi:signal transduction histidine kinase
VETHPRTDGAPELLLLTKEKLGQKNTYLVALVVGTAINFYGHFLVPWARGATDPVAHFVDEFGRNPGLVGASVVIAYLFPVLVGLYSSVATGLSGSARERDLLRLASFPEKNPNPVIEVDLNAKVTYVNPVANKRFPKLDRKGLRHPMMRDLKRVVKRLKQGKKAITRETTVGKRVYQQNIVYLEDVELVRLYTADITDRKKAEKDLVRLASFPEKNPNPVIEVDLEAHVTYVNPLARERFPDLDDKGLEHSMLRDLDRIVEQLKEGKESAVTRETVVGEHVYQQNMVYLADAKLVRLYTADITDRKKAEKDLVRLASFPEKNPNPVIEVALDGSVSYVNPLARERFPDLAERGNAHPLLEGMANIVETIKKTRAPHDREIQVRGFIYRQNIVYLAESNLVRLFIHDVTTLKQLQARIQRNLAELEKAHKELADAQLKLVESEKRAALSQLVAGIAHEINTPVGAIHSTHDTLQRAAEKMVKIVETEFEEGTKVHRQLKALANVLQDAARVIATASDRVGTIVARMRNFARLDEAEFKMVNANEGLQSTLQLVQRDLEGRIELIESYGDIPSINCFPARLNQAFLSVLMNSIQAIHGTGHIWVSTTAEGDTLDINIRDDGAGIAEKHLAEIFAPGFTTKGVGVGTGLGLSLCKQTVDDHGGSVEVDSELGEGTTVTIKIPIAGVAPPPSRLTR